MALLTASQISADSLVSAWNNTSLDTKEKLCQALNTTWEVVRGKVRSAAIKNRLTVERVSGNIVANDTTSAPATQAQPQQPATTAQAQPAPAADVSFEGMQAQPSQQPDLNNVPFGTRPSVTQAIRINVQVGTNSITSSEMSGNINELKSQIIRLVSEAQIKNFTVFEVGNQGAQTPVASIDTMKHGFSYVIQDNNIAA